MILNKSSVERGLSHAYVYKTEMVDLREEKGKKSVLEPEPHDARSRVRECVWGKCEECAGARATQRTVIWVQESVYDGKVWGYC